MAEQRTGETGRTGPILAVAIALFGFAIIFAGFNIWRTTWRRKSGPSALPTSERAPEEGPKVILDRLAGLDPASARTEREARVGEEVRWTGVVAKVSRPGAGSPPSLRVRHAGGYEANVVFPESAEAEIMGLEGREITYRGHLESIAPDDLRVVDAVLLKR